MSRLKVEVSSCDVSAKLLRVVFWNVVAPGWDGWLGERGGDVLTTGCCCGRGDHRFGFNHFFDHYFALNLDHDFFDNFDFFFHDHCYDSGFRCCRRLSGRSRGCPRPASLSGRTRQSLVDDSFASDFDDFFYDYGLNHRFALHCHFLFNDYRLEHWLAGH